MKMSYMYVALAGLSTVAAAQEIRQGTTADILGQANALFAAPNLITVNSATLVAEKVTNGCLAGTLPETIQFGVATGFLGANGFVLSNAWTENQDEENPPLIMQDDPCASSEGAVGGATVACEGTSTTIAANLLGGSGATATSADAAIYTIDFTTLVSTTMDLSYNLATFELPSDPGFYDSFAISIQGGAFGAGTILAGGATNSGPIGDPWVLTPTTPAPTSEYNSLITNGFFVVPAHSTGLRTIEVALDAATTYQLEFVVADGGDGIIDGSCNSSTDAVIDTSLFVGMHTYQTGNPVGITPGWDIGRLGHAATSGSIFSPDLQISLDGAAPGTLLILAQSPQQLPAFTFGLVAPNEVLVGVMPLTLNGPFVSSGTGSDVFPPTAPVLPPILAGSNFNFQWWGNDGSGWKNSKGMNVKF